MEIIIISPRATLCFCFCLIRFDYTNKVHVGSCKLNTVKPVLNRHVKRTPCIKWTLERRCSLDVGLTVYNTAGLVLWCTSSSDSEFVVIFISVAGHFQLPHA